MRVRDGLRDQSVDRHVAKRERARDLHRALEEPDGFDESPPPQHGYGEADETIHETVGMVIRLGDAHRLAARGHGALKTSRLVCLLDPSSTPGPSAEHRAQCTRTSRGGAHGAGRPDR